MGSKLVHQCRAPCPRPTIGELNVTPPAVALEQHAHLTRQSGLRLAAPTRDEALVARVKDGDQDAFGELVAPYLPGLEKLLRPLARQREDVSDLVQDALLRALKNLHRFQGGRFSTWLYRVGVNLALTSARRNTVCRRILDPKGPFVISAPDQPVAPEDRAAAREDAARIRDAIHRLPAPCREVVELRYVRDLSCKDIAAMLGKTPNAVSLLLFRARRRLRDAFATG